MTKGFKKNGKFRPTERKKLYKSSLDKKTLELRQTESQKKRAGKAQREGTHQHVSFTNLVKDIKKKQPELSDTRARKIAGSIQSKSRARFGSKVTSSKGRKHVEPAI